MREKGKHLDQFDRDRIKSLLDKGCSIRDIGRVMDIHHSTISREIKRNKHGKDGRTEIAKHDTYNPELADHKAYVRRKYAKFQGKKINDNSKLQEHIIAKLESHCNPDEISGHLKLHFDCTAKRCTQPDAGAGCSGGSMYVNKNTIYEWLDTARGEPYSKLLYSARRGRRRRNRKTKDKRQLIPNRTSIDKRPIGATNLTRYFHWEQDAVVSPKSAPGSASLSVLQERKTKYVLASVIPNMKPAQHIQPTIELSEHYKMLSVTYDNGIENRYHEQLHPLGIDTYFADPYSSYQKAMVENANKMIRRYYPKGTDFANITQTELNKHVYIINKKPRKILGYKSALQLALEKGVILGGGAVGGGI